MKTRFSGSCPKMGCLAFNRKDYYHGKFKRHMVIINSCMSKRSAESVAYLLLHYETVSAMWSNILSWIGLAWVMPNRVVDQFSSWRGLGGSPKIADVRKVVPTCLGAFGRKGIEN